MASVFPRFLATALLSILLVCSLAWTIAAYQDSLAIVGLASAMNRGDMRNIRKDFRRLDNAILLSPFDADYRMQQVYFFRERCKLTEKRADTSFCCTAADLSAYRKILRLRPVWGDAWLDYADCLDASGSDQRLTALQSLDRALRLAPVNFGVSRRALPIGFDLLEGMNESQRRRFTKTVDLVLTSFPSYVIRQAVKANQVAYLRPLLRNDRQRRLLKKWLKRAQAAKR